MAVLLRHAEQARDRLQRQLGGDVEQEVAVRPRPTAASTIARRPCAELVLENRQRARRHASPSRAGGALVARIVHHVEEDAGRESGGRSSISVPPPSRVPPRSDE